MHIPIVVGAFAVLLFSYGLGVLCGGGITGYYAGYLAGIGLMWWVAGKIAWWC